VVKPFFSASTTNLSNSCIEYCSWAAQYPIETITREERANGKNVCDDSSIYFGKRISDLWRNWQVIAIYLLAMMATATAISLRIEVMSFLISLTSTKVIDKEVQQDSEGALAAEKM
jgi:hypothetical protein